MMIDSIFSCDLIVIQWDINGICPCFFPRAATAQMAGRTPPRGLDPAGAHDEWNSVPNFCWLMIIVDYTTLLLLIWG